MTKYINLSSAQLSQCPILYGTINYLKDFLGEPNSRLEEIGYKGSVCPFTPKVLENQTVSFIREFMDVKDAEVIAKIKKKLLEVYLPEFFSIVEPNVKESCRKLACLLVIVDGLNSALDCNKFFSSVQKDLQPEFVQNGLLLSELHPYSKVPSVRNLEFFPSRPPFPIFFIRRVIPNDIPYLLRKDRYDEMTYGKIFSVLKRDFGIGTIEKEMERLGKTVEIPSCQHPYCGCPVVSTHPVGFGLLSCEEIGVRCRSEGIKLFLKTDFGFYV